MKVMSVTDSKLKLGQVYRSEAQGRERVRVKVQSWGRCGSGLELELVGDQ